jgi:hypothetical protein
VPVQLANAVNVTPSLYRIATVYPVIADPPSAGVSQVIKTLVPTIVAVGAAGELGSVAGITAPLPSGDAAELPISFVAKTLV